MYIHCTLIPMLAAAGELKTKPTQHSVKELRSIGIQPNVIVCRTEHPLSDDLKRKVALFCDIDPAAVIEARDAETLYEVPLMLQAQHLDRIVVDHLGLPKGEPDMQEWIDLIDKVKSLTDRTRVAIVGKYVSLHDAYLSVVESLAHAGIANDTEVEIDWINSEDVTEDNVATLLGEVDGIYSTGRIWRSGYRRKD